jgi:two-component system, OmpR family, response regulator ResD
MADVENSAATTERETSAAAAGTGLLPNGQGGVLVVEDDPEINELVGAYAQIAGFEYRPALDGSTALKEVQQRRPAVIVLDLMLPDLDGFEVLRRVKADAGSAAVPVIILTALDSERSRQEGCRIGAADYMTKPFDPDRLIDTIARHAARA